MNKKQKNINDQNKQQIVDMLSNMLAQCRNADVASTLMTIQQRLGEQMATDSKEVEKVDEKIVERLTNLQKDVINGSFQAANLQLEKVQALVSERSTHCLGSRRKKVGFFAWLFRRKNKAKSENDLYDTNTLLDLMIARAQDQFDACKAEMAKVAGQLAKDQENASTVNRWKKLKIEKKGFQDRLTMLLSESYRAALVKEMENLTNEHKALLASRTCTDEQFDVIMANFNAVQQQVAADKQRNKTAENAFFNSGSTETSIYNDPDFIEATGGKTAAAAYDTPAASAPSVGFGIENDPDFIAIVGDKQPAGKKTVKSDAKRWEMLADEIEDIIRELERAEFKFENAIDEKDAEMKVIRDDLCRLLKKRDAASASECLTLDGQIDRLRAKYETGKVALKKLRQASAINGEKLANALTIRDQIRIDEISNGINEVDSGIFAQFEENAKALRRRVAESNEELERIGTINIVANGEEIQTQMYTGYGSDVAPKGEVKDEQKYDDLKAELGYSA